MKLHIVPPQFIDMAWWEEGASALSEVCNQTEDVTAGQLKMMLSRGERMLIRMDNDEDEIVGWGVAQVDQLPNLRVLHAYQMIAPAAHFERYFVLLKDIAQSMGCSRIRCSAKPVQARLYRMKCGFAPVYETLEVVL
jgi:hypothetical protein